MISFASNILMLFFSLGSVMSVLHASCYYLGALGRQISEKMAIFSQNEILPTFRYDFFAYYMFYTIIVNLPLSNLILLDMEAFEVRWQIHKFFPYLGIIALAGFLRFGFLRFSKVSLLSVSSLVATSLLMPQTAALGASELSVSTLFIIASALMLS